MAETQTDTAALKQAYYDAVEDYGAESAEVKEAVAALSAHLGAVKARVEGQLTQPQRDTLQQLRAKDA